MKLDVAKVSVPFKRTINISRVDYAAQDMLIVRLEQDGVAGYGEASRFAVYGAEIEPMAKALAVVAPILVRRRLADPADLWSELAPFFKDQPFAQCALDVAAHDLWAKLRGMPLYQALGLKAEGMPPSCYTVFLDTPARMLADLASYGDWPVIKVKVGIQGDIDNVRLLRANTAAAIRVDANGGWTADVAAAKSDELASLGVTSVEQPLKPDDWSGMATLSRTSALPLFADESCRTFADLERCAQVFVGVNIKLMKAGGITPALRMIREARRLGLQVMLGCMPETTIGVSAIAHLASLLNCMDADGPELMAGDVARGLRLTRGRFHHNRLPGLGFELDDQLIFGSRLP